MKNNFEVPKNQLIKLAKKYSLKELALFGSVLTAEFGTGSDIDVLIEFEPSAKASLFDLVEIKEELESIFNRKVDVVEKTGLQNPFRKKAILEKREILYAA